MQVNIQTNASLEVLKNIEGILRAFELLTRIDYLDEGCGLSLAEQEKLKKTLKECEDGTAKFVGLQEAMEHSKKHLRSLGF